jgi:hypothetical protein
VRFVKRCVQLAYEPSRAHIILHNIEVSIMSLDDESRLHELQLTTTNLKIKNAHNIIQNTQVR